MGAETSSVSPLAPLVALLDDGSGSVMRWADDLRRHDCRVEPSGMTWPRLPTDAVIVAPAGLVAGRTPGGAGGPAVIAIYADEEKDGVLPLLEHLADDIFPREGSARELLARIRALVRRRRRAPRPACAARALDLDPLTESLKAGGRQVALTQREFALATALLAADGRVLSRDALIIAVMGDEAEVYDRAIDCLVVRLRRKLVSVLPADPVVTHIGAGYSLDTRRLGPSRVRFTPVA
jgi:hypothetical protein